MEKPQKKFKNVTVEKIQKKIFKGFFRKVVGTISQNKGI